jgi:hypothetical protein
VTGFRELLPEAGFDVAYDRAFGDFGRLRETAGFTRTYRILVRL